MTAPPCEVVINGENQDTLETVVLDMMVALFSCLQRVLVDFSFLRHHVQNESQQPFCQLMSPVAQLKLNSSSVSLQVSEVDALAAACCHGGGIAE